MDDKGHVSLSPMVTTGFVEATDDSKRASVPTIDATAVLEPVKSHHPITYRPDIDGLRALAVVPVVIFHAYPKALPGGFIGVDIFFVISGYLISSILFKEHTKGTFTYADFYSRRIRRIFPALILVLAFSLTMGCLWFLAAPLKKMAATLVAGGCFGANLQLMTIEQGYFDSSTKENPLLHLWSLGVEEQFYIFWPMFASLVVRLPTRMAILVQLVVLVASFVCNVAFLGFHGSDKYSFYFPLSRFWQMAIGGLLAYINMPSSEIKVRTATLSSKLSAMFSICGLLSIVVGFVILDESMDFPGYWSLLPTLGAAALIFAGPTTPLNQLILGSKPLVLIGHLSYALYLWHWPLLVFAKVYFPNPTIRSFFWEPYSMALLAVGLSIVTLYGVENRLRRRQSRILVPLLACFVLAEIAFGVYVYHNSDGFSPLSAEILAARHVFQDLGPSELVNWSIPPRRSEPTLAKIQAAADYFDFGGYKLLADGPADLVPKLLHENGHLTHTLVVLGDSHANMLAPRFQRLLQVAILQNTSFPVVYLRGRSGTAALACNAKTHASDAAFVAQTNPKVVLHVTNWIQFLRGGGGDGQPAAASPKCCMAGYGDACRYQNWADVDALINQFEAEMASLVRQGIKVFVATVNPEGPEFDWKNMLNGGRVAAVGPVSRAAFRQRHERVITRVEKAIAAANATLIDFSTDQCDGDVCHVVSMREGEPVTWDSNHIRPFYARNYLTSLDQVVRAALED
ncbi:Aste57867_2327 [Aphanomyces stellatus]|uniref:Aste57867_2327 protein n=1 Tax=Aphanomyces stellatus TaxID=120398 RepID=A0A485K7E5_9STRA|nr:hypothetical protein As57867_002322 [Aphanomyces stellatus]VFT79529.1 Aste57867_2327 [Aphanomyces stellatus]